MVGVSGRRKGKGRAHLHVDFELLDDALVGFDESVVDVQSETVRRYTSQPSVPLLVAEEK